MGKELEMKNGDVVDADADDLRELVSEWRSAATYLREHSDEYADPKRSQGAANALGDAADDLEELLNGS